MMRLTASEMAGGRKGERALQCDSHARRKATWFLSPKHAIQAPFMADIPCAFGGAAEALDTYLSMLAAFLPLSNAAMCMSTKAALHPHSVRRYSFALAEPPSSEQNNRAQAEGNDESDCSVKVE